MRLSKTWAPGDVLLWLCILLPLTTALPLNVLSMKVAVIQSPMFVYSVGAMLLVAAWVGKSDGWLGLFVGWHVLGLLWYPVVSAFETAELLMLSAVGLLAVRALPEDRRRLMPVVLVGLGLFQVLDGAQQMLGYDVLHWGLHRILPVDGPIGTLGNRGYYGMYLAMLAPLAPLWALPLFLLALVLAKCNLAVLAVACGLGWRYRAKTRPWHWAALCLAGLAAMAAMRGAVWLSGAWGRIEIWGLALGQIEGWQWLIGAGPGSWSVQIPLAQEDLRVLAQALFFHAHNEWLQVLYEGGLVAIALLLGWLWRHRAAFTGPYGGCWIAMLIGSVGSFGFRLAIPGATALVLIGLATPNESSNAEHSHAATKGDSHV